MPEEFKAHYEVKDGKKMLVIEAKSETIVHPDGRKDVIIRVPTLSVINSFRKEQEGK